MDVKLSVADSDFYNLKSLWACFNIIAEMYGEKDSSDYDTFARWVHSARVFSYFKQNKHFPAPYDRALYLDESNVRYIKILLILYLTEVLGREKTEQVVLSLDAEYKEVADLILCLYKMPGEAVNYSMNGAPAGSISVYSLYILKR